MAAGRRLLAAMAAIVLAAAANGQRADQTPVLQAGPPTACYNSSGLPQRCLPPFENAAFGVLIEASNTCGENSDIYYCIQTGSSTRKSCDICTAGQFRSEYLTDLHHDYENQTRWQSETMNEGIQYPSNVNLVLNLGKAFDITYVRLVFYSPRPESFAIYKRTRQDSEWEPYQYYSATCRETYGQPESTSTDIGAETRPLCTSEYSDISPLKGGNVAFSTLEGRPSAYKFDSRPELQEWVTATDIRITLDRLNTFGDEVFGDQQVLQSYWYSIADIAVGARCKCNGHASKCETTYGPDNRRERRCVCEHNTAGPDCGKCKDLYNDAPWGRASQNQAHECKICNCNGYSDTCYFDKELFARTGHGGHCTNCVQNRDGPNCERCKENYYQNSDNVCIPCDCNPTGSRSLQCNSNGQCVCKPGVTGEKCHECSLNYYQFSNQGCKPCLCNEAGSYNNRAYCDSNTGVCQCKQNVEGKQCRQCKPGYFNLDYENQVGCTPCFCYGKSSDCQSATGYAKVILESNFVRNNEKWIAQDSHRKTIGLKYNSKSKHIAVTSPSYEPIYFVAPERFLGDQRASYNHDLKFTLYTAENSAYSPSADLELEGAETYISIPIINQGNVAPSGKKHEYVFRLHESSYYGWSPSLTDREFMTILSNLTAIRIKGTYSNQGIGYLENFKLETAQRGAAGQPAMWIEMCTCPKGYVGQFCESCAPGYRHDPVMGGPASPCVPCDCNKHANICDSETGRCICEHNTAGDNCNFCAKGYYGNALAGTPYDCQQCPCPNNGPCTLLPNSIVACTECSKGYAGLKCEICADGYFGDPLGNFGKVQICKPCECNLNIDTNAIGNCNKTTGECLKCIYNTAGPNCDHCLPGYYGDALAPNKGDCQQCECFPAGTLEDSVGIPKCDRLNGQCSCKPNVEGRNCDTCQEGFYNIVSGDGCHACDCNPEGSFNHTCDLKTGQCHCREGVTGLRCDECMPHRYGFSNTGCKECLCDAVGSRGLQCDPSGQCPCYDNVEGLRCNRCKENKYDRQRGCVNCPDCYNLVQDSVNLHRDKLRKLEKMLQDIIKNPTVNSDSQFENNLDNIKKEINKVLADAKNVGDTGEDGKTLVQKLEDFNDRLNNAVKQLQNIKNLTAETENFSEQSKSLIKEAENYLESSTKELSHANDYLHTDGTAAFEKAFNRSKEFGQQSTQMSSIAQESRLIAENLEKEAKNIKNIAESANATSYEAYDWTMKGFTQQLNITNNLKALRLEIANAEKKLKNVLNLTDQSQAKSMEVYDNSLDLHAQMRYVNVSSLDTKSLRTRAEEMSLQADDIKNKIDELMRTNKDLIITLGNQIKDSQKLKNEFDIQHSNMKENLDDLHAVSEKAKDAVKNVTRMFDEAQKTNSTLKKFHQNVQTSRAEAEEAIKKIPQIKKTIQDAEKSTNNIKDSLNEAEKNAKHASRVAQEAHHKYAKQASQEAHEIKAKANMAKSNATSLHEEANKLAARIVDTQTKIKDLENQVDKDKNMTYDAKTKVSHVKTDVMEAENKVKKGLEDIKEIMDHLVNLPKLDDKDLDALEKRLEEAKKELKNADVANKIQLLQNSRDSIQKWSKEYQNDIAQLKDQVKTVKNIHDHLPNGCFNKINLEP